MIIKGSLHIGVFFRSYVELGGHHADGLLVTVGLGHRGSEDVLVYDDSGVVGGDVGYLCGWSWGWG